MFERILVPLDGSELAEVAIPYGEELAGRLDSEVVLLHVSRPDQETYHRMHEVYLDKVADIVQRAVKKRFPKCKGFQIRGEALAGEAAAVICDYVQKNDIGLIIMAARDTSGSGAWMLGSVLDRVARAVKIPTLVIRAKESRPVEVKKKLINRILLPLDGSEASQTALPYAIELAKRVKAGITLFRMGRRAYITYADAEGAPFLDVDLARADASEERRINAYLIGIEQGIRQEHIPVTHAVALGGDPAHYILQQEKGGSADLVLMTTRGRSPLKRWVFGSVTEKVLREGDLPLLLVRKSTD